ncbi:MAG: hypothetical protein HY080_01355 [Gammaproteobacteria bacterium]|nr:hypothetical protein [Gammaproteobacteria bacterium]
MSIRCYAQRLLNPFRGVMNVIEFEAAEAVTTDGIHWDIYVRNAELVRDLAEAAWVQTSDIRYGRWSVAEGLKRGPIQPSADFVRMEELGTVVYEHLLTVHEQVPFAFADCYELWLLDTQQRPLALLNSVTQPREMVHDQMLRWRAGYLCERIFRPAVLQKLPLARPNSTAAEYLTNYINTLTRQPAQAQWFVRTAEGGHGLQGINIVPEIIERFLPREVFPDLLIHTQHHDALHSQLIDAFLIWQAPWLLLLQHLDEATRRYYEPLARRQALLVEKQYRLYPQILDKAQINAARVEAQLRRVQRDANQDLDAMSVFYIELGKQEYGL